MPLFHPDSSLQKQSNISRQKSKGFKEEKKQLNKRNE